MQPKTPVIELLRVSTQEQGGEDRAGIPRQVEANRLTIERRGLLVVRTFKLIDVSGATVMYSPEMAEMMAMIRSGQARGIVVADFDRLLRPDDFRSLAILQDIREAGALIYLPDQVLDLNTQAGFLISGLQSVIAGNELNQIKRRMLGAKEEKRRQGKHPGNHLTLPLGVGYDRKAERYFYTEESAKVREFFDLFHRQGIHNFMELGRLTGIQGQTIRKLLRNELYIGFRHYRQKRADERRVKADGRRADKRKVARAQHEAIRVKVIENPLIPEPVFWEVQDMLDGRHGEYTDRRQAGKRIFLFSGLVRCAVCGDPMYTVPGGPEREHRDYYYCRRKSNHYRVHHGLPPCPSSYLRRAVVEDMLTRFIADRLASPEYVLGEIQGLFASRDDSALDRERREAEERIAALRRKKKRLLGLFVQDVFSEEELSEKAGEMQAEIERQEARLSALIAPAAMPDPEDYREAVEAMAVAFCEFPFWGDMEKREFLRLQRPEFFIGPDGVSKFMLPVYKRFPRMGRGSWPPPA